MAETGELGINNLEAGQGACDKLASAMQELKVTIEAANGAFDPLTEVNPDLGTKFVSELYQGLTDILTFLNEHVYPAAQTYFQPDNPIEGQAENPVENGDNPVTPPTGTSTYHNDHVHINEQPVDVTEDGTTPPTTEPINFYNVAEQLTVPLDNLELSQIDGAVESLISLAEGKNKYLDEYIEDDAYADEIKAMLMKSPYLPQAFKDLIADMDSKTVRMYIEGLLKGENPEVFELNPLNLGIVYSYLMQIAQENGITVEELLNNPKYSELLRKVLGKFKNVVDLLKGWEELPAEEFQANILKMYDGDGTFDLPQEDMDVMKSFVDYISEETGIYYEELLTDTTYAETLKDAALQFGKACVFFSATSHFTDAGMRRSSSRMFDGTHVKAFGMDAKEVQSFQEEVSNLAKEKNTTVDKLLTDEKYADDVKELLKNSKNAEGVGSIFKNANSKVSQNVANNIFNTKLKVLYEVENIEGVLVNEETGKEEIAATTHMNITGYEIASDFYNEANEKLNAALTNTNVTDSASTQTKTDSTTTTESTSSTQK